MFSFRQCMCCYRDIKNFDRFTRLTQSVVHSTLQQLQAIQDEDKEGDCEKREEVDNEDEKKKEKTKAATTPVVDTSVMLDSKRKHSWSQQDREKLLHLLSKIFLLNFPLYIAMKHGGAINPLAPVKVISLPRLMEMNI